MVEEIPHRDYQVECVSCAWEGKVSDLRAFWDDGGQGCPECGCEHFASDMPHGWVTETGVIPVEVRGA